MGKSDIKKEDIIKILENGIRSLEESEKELSKLKLIHDKLGWEDPAKPVKTSIKYYKEELAKIRDSKNSRYDLAI